MSETSYGGDTSTTAASETEYYGIPLQRENSASVIARFKSSPQAPSPTKPVGGKIYRLVQPISTVQSDPPPTAF